MNTTQAKEGEMDSFKIYVRFKGGAWSMVEEHGADALRSAVERLTRGPGSVMVEEVKVVDSEDYTNFLWKAGRLLYPVEGVHF